jgi:hypothetical protein
MNIRTFKIFLLILAFGLSSFAVADSTKGIEKAILSGDAKALSGYFGSLTTINIPGHNGNYSKAQAERIFKDFFKENPPLSFSFTSEISTSANRTSLMGRYIAKPDVKYLVKVTVSQDDHIIKEIQFN